MNCHCDENIEQERQNRLLVTLQRLLSLETVSVARTYQQAAQLVAEALTADKADVFLYDADIETLVALGTSDTPMGRRERAIGMHLMPIANRGRMIDVFLTGTSFLSGHVDEDPGELVGIKEGLGIKSEMAVAFEINAKRRGVLMASSAQAAAFSEQDLHFLEAVAQWVGIVIHRSELIERQTKDAAEQGRRMAAEELLTVMAHDLRNYLTPLKVHLELLERRARQENRSKDVRDLISSRRAMKNLERLISDLLDVARLDQGIFAITPQPLNVVDLVIEQAQVFRTPQHDVIMQAPNELAVTADPDRIRQVLENLLANAVKYALAGTPILINVEEQQRAEGRFALVTVSNQGVAIPSDLLSSLFQPFVKGSISTGLGLGLYLAHRIARLHQGSLTIDTLSGEEVHFTLALPMQEENEVDVAGPVI